MKPYLALRILDEQQAIHGVGDVVMEDDVVGLEETNDRRPHHAALRTTTHGLDEEGGAQLIAEEHQELESIASENGNIVHAAIEEITAHLPLEEVRHVDLNAWQMP